ncbi:hypothetical protein K7640_22155 [Micromonospora sp. PLK6-60]|nr:hypothetical protein [Micromonospora sp. PLK6-60]
MRTALAGTTGNAMLMGAAEVSSPLGWVLLPGLLGVTIRPRAAALVSAWAGVLVAVSVAVPIVPGHRTDPSALLVSAMCLAAAPALAWARRRRRRAAVVRAAAPPDVAVFTMPAGPGRAALAICRSPGEVAAAVPVRDGGLRVLVGTAVGDALADRAGTRAIERTFHQQAGRPRRTLPQLARALRRAVHDLAPAGYLDATIVQVDRAGRVEAVRCGSPDVGTPDGPAGVPAGPALGLTAPATEPTGATEVTGGRVTARRIAVVSTGFTDTHGERWVRVLGEAIRDDDPARAAQRLTRAEPGGGRTGPALVIDLSPAG